MRSPCSFFVMTNRALPPPMRSALVQRHRSSPIIQSSRSFSAVRVSPSGGYGASNRTSSSLISGQSRLSCMAGSLPFCGGRIRPIFRKSPEITIPPALSVVSGQEARITISMVQQISPSEIRILRRISGSAPNGIVLTVSNISSLPSSELCRRRFEARDMVSFSSPISTGRVRSVKVPVFRV